MTVTFNDLDDLDTAVVKSTTTSKYSSTTEDCPKCYGKGQVIIGITHRRSVACFTCNGSGKVTGKKIVRMAAAKKAVATRIRNLTHAVDQFKISHPAEFALLYRSHSNFMLSLRDQLEQRGTLSDRQIAAITRCVESDVNQKTARDAQATTVDVAEMRDIADMSVFLNTKIPSFRTEKVTVTFAKKGSKNFGSLYVKDTKTKTYLGKITETGKFWPTTDCTNDHKTSLLEVAKDPLAAAINYGRLTGTCACCGRELSDDKSIEMGIGPVCATKYFGVIR